MARKVALALTFASAFGLSGALLDNGSSSGWSLGSVAWAQDKKTVSVLEIQGAPPKLKAAIEKALRAKYTLVPEAKWNATARKLNVTGQGADDIVLVANELKVDAVVTGKVKKDKESGKWRLNIAARHGATGKPLGKIQIDLKSERPDAASISQAEQEIPSAVELAIAGPPPEQPAVAETKPEPVSPSLLGKEDDPLERMRKMEEERRREEGKVDRPVWYPFVDASAGFILNGRDFQYTEEAGDTSAVKCYDVSTVRDDQDFSGPVRTNLQYNKLRSCPKYAASVTGGVRVDITGYPLAMLRHSWLRGIGIGVLFDYMFWPPSRTGGTNSRDLATQEWRLEAGLRYHWNILNKRSRPSILFNVSYGLHNFQVQKEKVTAQGAPMRWRYQNASGIVKDLDGTDDHGLPDISYQYVSIGLGGRIPYYATEKWFIGLLVNVNFHAMLSYGEIATAFVDRSVPDGLTRDGGYGPASGFGVRAGFTPVEVVPWKGLTIRLSGFYELFKYSFNYGTNDTLVQATSAAGVSLDNAARHLAQGATDQYFGAIVSVGYQY
ncbi:MAG: hypothetical protein U1A78_36360 [Polyangia bacterium]